MHYLNGFENDENFDPERAYKNLCELQDKFVDDETDSQTKKHSREWLRIYLNLPKFPNSRQRIEICSLNQMRKSCYKAIEEENMNLRNLVAKYEQKVNTFISKHGALIPMFEKKKWEKKICTTKEDAKKIMFTSKIEEKIENENVQKRENCISPPTCS